MTWRRTVIAVGCVLGLMGSVIPAGAEPDSARDLVFTDRGPVRGVVTDTFRLFQGIPYAAPPVGALRWQPPQQPARWREPLDASKPAADCAQPESGFGTPASFVEDCLYVNVTTPLRARHRLPVMVWIHGGGYTAGSGAVYNATKLAVEGDVVVVTINYRLGPFGFLALPALSAEHPGVQSGNYGIEDQQAALRWVRRNASAFGGDPGNVTIFGESAGSGSVCAHLVSPTAAGLFHRAIGQSFSCAARVASAATAEGAGAAFAAGFGCTDTAQAAECLRTKAVPDLLRSWQQDTSPVVGGRELPLQPPDALRQDRFHHVPLMLGNNLDELRLFVSLEFDAVGRPVTSAQYEQIIRDTYGAAADQVLRLYPVANYPTPSIALATVQGDFGTALSTCDHLTSYRLASARPHAVPVYGYHFVDRTAPALVDVPNFDEGAEHASELPFLFPGLFGRPLSAEQQDLATKMVRYWTNFAASGDPNGRGLPDWQRFRSSEDVLALGLGPRGIRPFDIAANSNCAFWDSISR